jgi:hypothetical protein
VSAAALRLRRPVRLPAEFYTPGVRRGYTLVRGRVPIASERVLLTRASCIHVFADTWFFTEHVESAFDPDNAWLIGVDLRTGLRCRKLVAVSRLVVERSAASGGWAS